MIKKRIMIVEDEAITGLSMRKTLEDADYEVAGGKVFASAEEALEATKELRPDLILMDIVLQGEIDGIMAAKKIQEKLHIPIIYVTA